MAGLSNSRFDRLVGLTEAKRQIQALPELVRRHAYVEIKRSTEEMAATVRADVPRRNANAVPGYSGGALQGRIAGRASQKHLIGMVGITRGAIVVNSRGRTATLRQTSVKVMRRRKDGSYVQSYRRRYLSKEQRANVTQAGGHIIQPTKYGHLVEFGTSERVSKSGKSSGAASPRPYMRPAARRNQASFESGMKSVLSVDVVNALKQQGYKGGGV